MRRALLVLPFAAAAVTAVLSFGAVAGDLRRPAQRRSRNTARTLYDTHCTSCHGVDGEGIADRGPPLVTEGPAAVDFVLRTGRMPMADPFMQANRGPVQFSDEEIRALVAYAGSFGDGAGVPEVDIATATSPTAARSIASTAPPVTSRPSPARRSGAVPRHQR